MWRTGSAWLVADAFHYKPINLKLSAVCRNLSTASTVSEPATNVATQKPFHHLSPEEAKRAIPGMLFTTSGMLLGTVIAGGVAAIGLVSMFYTGLYIRSVASAMKSGPSSGPTLQAPPPPPKSLVDLILERKAELDRELDGLKRAANTPEVQRRKRAIQEELSHYRTNPPTWWWPFG